VALETALLDELFGLGAEVAVVSVRKPSFLRLVDGVPLGADVDAARETDLAPRLDRRRALLRVVAVDNRGGRGSAVRRVHGYRRGRPGGERDLVRLSRAAGQGQVGLLEVLDVELERVQAAAIDGVFHPMNNLLRRHVFLAPDGRGHSAGFAVDGYDVELVAA
jgi:hypothetical protein